MNPGSLCGPLQSPNNSVIAPITDTLNNASNAQITYQFSPGGMIGATGNFSELSYPDQAQVPGLFGSSAAGGSLFYTHRFVWETLHRGHLSISEVCDPFRRSFDPRVCRQRRRRA